MIASECCYLFAPMNAGNKDVLGLIGGFRESTRSWRELLLDLKRRGPEAAPKPAVGDGAMG